MLHEVNLALLSSCHNSEWQISLIGFCKARSSVLRRDNYLSHPQCAITSARLGVLKKTNNNHSCRRLLQVDFHDTTLDDQTKPPLFMSPHIWLQWRNKQFYLFLPWKSCFLLEVSWQSGFVLYWHPGEVMLKLTACKWVLLKQRLLKGFTSACKRSFWKSECHSFHSFDIPFANSISFISADDSAGQNTQSLGTGGGGTGASHMQLRWWLAGLFWILIEQEICHGKGSQELWYFVTKYYK